MADWLSRMLFWLSTGPDDKHKKTDEEIGLRAPSAVSMHKIESGPESSARMLAGLPPPSGRRFARAFFSKQFSLPIVPCVKDGARLAITDNGTNGRDAYERKSDDRDVKIQLSQIIKPENMLKDDKTKTQTIRQFDSSYNVVIEVALVVIDPTWDPQEQYIRVHLQNIGVYQQSQITLGDVDAILLRSTETHVRPPTPRGTCPLNPKKGVVGWCYKCNTRPNTVTLYQAPLTDDQIIKYATELQSMSGTHGHVKSEARVARRVSSNDDDSDDNSGNDGLELNPVSTLARDMCASGAARYQSDGTPGGTVFATRDSWSKEVALASQRILFNLPLADVELATLRLCARAEARSVRPSQTLQVSLVVQCLALNE